MSIFISPADLALIYNPLISSILQCPWAPGVWQDISRNWWKWYEMECSCKPELCFVQGVFFRSIWLSILKAFISPTFGPSEHYWCVHFIWECYQLLNQNRCKLTSSVHKWIARQNHTHSCVPSRFQYWQWGQMLWHCFSSHVDYSGNELLNISHSKQEMDDRFMKFLDQALACNSCSCMVSEIMACVAFASLVTVLSVSDWRRLMEKLYWGFKYYLCIRLWSA